MPISIDSALENVSLMRETAPGNFGKSHTLVLGPFLMPRSQSIEDSLFHLAVLGMDHDDVRYPNICRAPSGPGSLPSLPSACIP